MLQLTTPNTVSATLCKAIVLQCCAFIKGLLIALMAYNSMTMSASDKGSKLEPLMSSVCPMTPGRHHGHDGTPSVIREAQELLR